MITTSRKTIGIKQSIKMRQYLLGMMVFISAMLSGCNGATPPALHRLSCDDTINTALPIQSSSFGFNLQNTRNASNAQINSTNVQTLKLDHAYVDPDAVEKRGAVAVTDQVIYLSSAKKVMAVNRTLGCTYWQYEAADAIRSASVLLVDDISLKKRVVYVGTYYGKIIALDAANGKEIWKVRVSKDRFNHMITGGMQYYNGKLVIPVATKEVIFAAAEPVCCFSHGLLLMLNSKDGSVIWKKQMTERAVRQPHSRHLGPNGVSIWSTPVVDVVRQQIIVGTSSNLTTPATENENSIIAYNMADGEVKWFFRGSSPDFYNASCDLDPPLNFNCSYPSDDFDMITPILTTTPAGEAVVIAADKGGTVYSLNPTDGSLNWFNRLGVGGKLGGIHWGMAVDQQRVYAAITDLGSAKLGELQGMLGFNIYNGLLPVPVYLMPGARPGIYALDIESGGLEWEAHSSHVQNGELFDSLYSAALSISNDVLFAGSLDGAVRAYNTTNGDELWSYNTAVNVEGKDGLSGQGGTIDSVGPIPVNNSVYVNSGYSTFAGENEYNGGQGNALFIFRLEGNTRAQSRSRL